MPPVTHLRPNGTLPPTTDPGPHKKIDQTQPALEAAGGQIDYGRALPEVQGSDVALPTPAKQRPSPPPTVGARIAKLPSAVGLVRSFGQDFSDGTSARGAHGVVTPGAAYVDSAQNPWTVNINTFRLAPEPWDTQYVAGVVSDQDY